MKKIFTNFLDDSIDSRFLFDRSKRNIWSVEGNSRSVGKLKKFIAKSQVDSIDSQFLFDQSKRNIQLIEGNSQSVETREIEFSRIFTKQFSTVFINKIPSYEHNRLTLRSKTEFHWCYILKVQFNTLNIKLKQHHNNNLNNHAENWLKNLLTSWNYYL